MTLQGKNPGFKRNVYKLLDCERDCVLLHYIGDHNIGSQYPHGNSKSQNPRPFIRTCPSILQSIDTHEEDQEGNPSDATMDNCEEDQEIHPAAAATTAASYDDVRKSCSVTNEVTQLSRARLDEINIALP